jgi:hypothetical protein
MHELRGLLRIFAMHLSLSWNQGQSYFMRREKEWTITPSLLTFFEGQAGNFMLDAKRVQRLHLLHQDNSPK